MISFAVWTRHQLEIGGRRAGRARDMPSRLGFSSRLPFGMSYFHLRAVVLSSLS